MQRLFACAHDGGSARRSLRNCDRRKPAIAGAELWRFTRYALCPDDRKSVWADFVPPNGEDWPTFHARVADAFAFIVSRRRSVNGKLVVVTHGFVCRALVERHALLPEGVIVPERFDNAGMTVLHERAPHEVSLMNCTRHLV